MSDNATTTRRLSITIKGAGPRTCAACECQDADEHLIYCGVFRRALQAECGAYVRLPACLAAEDNSKPAAVSQ